MNPRLFAAALLALLPALAVASDARPMTVDGMWAVKRLGPPSLSPDGKWVAVEVTAFDIEKDESSSNVWLLSTDGKEQKPLTSAPGKSSGPKWSPDGKISTFLQPAGRANGMYFDRQGNLLACADEKNELWSISPAGKVTVLVKDYQGRLLNGPNDLWIRPDGGLFFTDPLYKRPYWNRGPKEQDKEAVYYIGSDGKLRRVADDLERPNGIALAPNGHILYVANSDERTVLA